MAISCWTTDEHRVLMALAGVGIALYVVGIPSTGYALVRRHRTELNDEAVARRYRFMYDAYQRRFYYWEMLIMARKAAVAAVLVLVVDPYRQSIAGGVVALLALMMQAKFEPYRSDLLNRCELFSILVIALTALGGTVLTPHTDTDSFDGWGTAMAVVLIVLNAALVCGFLVAVVLAWWGARGGGDGDTTTGGGDGPTAVAAEVSAPATGDGGAFAIDFGGGGDGDIGGDFDVNPAFGSTGDWSLDDGDVTK